MSALTFALDHFPYSVNRRIFRWEVKVDESEGYRYRTKQQALAHAMGLSCARSDCTVIGSRGRCYFVPAGFGDDDCKSSSSGRG